MPDEVYKDTHDVSIHHFNVHVDNRGALHVTDLSKFSLNFVRLFILAASNPGEVRGRHAHKTCWLFAFASSAGVTLKTQNTYGSKEIPLDSNFGVLIPPYNWTEVIFETESAKLNVLASQQYDPSDYIYNLPSNTE
jgi:dTDP-4-dehydrorhamnose 3,5-epimerase-like enzyme